ncbi:cardiotrophin-2-like [Megalops cyprinoides]|uniref:cardiotrophin-2-like n=1 Tax=Megalops cyprinoides TaxID=118141 RepID=UPI00186459F0|nr:cardiotrophin-2-like [Megalops cyprinoides]
MRPYQQRALKFSYSLRFTIRIRTSVQELFLKFKAQELGDPQFEDRRLVLHTLPSISVDYSKWLHMQDVERLGLAARDLRSFWVHLDLQRRQIEEERGERKGQRNRLIQAVLAIQVDLQKLAHQINSQLRYLWSVASTRPLPCPLSGPTHSPPEKLLLLPQFLPPETWCRRLQGYVILRDLERYLAKLSRDFTLLKSRHGG